MTSSNGKPVFVLLLTLCFIVCAQMALAQTAPAPLPQTGQTTCWNGLGEPIDCAGTGQDGDVQSGVMWPDPRFTDNADGTVTDNLTGLTWIRKADCFDRVSWLDALQLPRALAHGQCDLTDNSVAGDWRLPNIIELRSLVDFGTFRPSLPAGHPFINFESAVYWSSSTVATFPSLGWFATFAVGPHVFDLKVNTFRILAVKGGLDNPVLARTGAQECFDATGMVIPCAGTGQDAEFQAGVPWPAPRFTDNADGTVLDNLSGLVWLKNAHCFGFQSWVNALAVVRTLREGICGLMDGSSEGEWRLPNIRELQSVMDNSAAAPALPSGHPIINMQPTLYWTSTSGQNFPIMAFFSLMSAGSTVFEHKKAELGTWAVRDGR